jgi:PadR family transcriptional regulator AphA
MGSSPVSSLNEWAVLGLVAEGETHGYAMSREFAADGALGRVWTVSRPLVYRAISSLIAKELVQKTGWLPGTNYPTRRLVEATEAGRTAFAAWLLEPVAHVRDARSELLLKLLFLDRGQLDPMPLVVAQEALIEPMHASLCGQLERCSGFDATIIRWRLYSIEALSHFLEDLRVGI